ncbi:hypothetical protein LINPERHAP2_LOCUS37022 [Linum perenne]
MQIQAMASAYEALDLYDVSAACPLQATSRRSWKKLRSVALISGGQKKLGEIGCKEPGPGDNIPSGNLSPISTPSMKKSPKSLFPISFELIALSFGDLAFSIVAYLAAGDIAPGCSQMSHEIVWIGVDYFRGDYVDDERSSRRLRNLIRVWVCGNEWLSDLVGVFADFESWWAWALELFSWRSVVAATAATMEESTVVVRFEIEERITKKKKKKHCLGEIEKVICF